MVYLCVETSWEQKAGRYRSSCSMSSVEILDIDITNCTKGPQSVPSCISKISVSQSYSVFFNEYLFKNVPCIIKGVALEWESFSQWVSNDAPNLKNLVSKYGSVEVPVTDCRKADQCKNYIPFEEYAEYLKNITPEKSLQSIMYLKDWHLRRENPEDDFYQVPKYFASDWLNEYAVDNNRDDYMFVYFGPKGSWTPFHADVYTSFSWSANVVGQKKWILFPPGEESKFLDAVGNLPSDIENLLNDGLTYFQVIQNTGDAIFIPSGWFHQVWNMEDTISINHNWINGCNIDTMLNSLKKNIEMVESEIIEFKDTEGWMEHCQVMLKSLFGINYEGFFEFVKYITVKRLNSLKNGCNLTFGNWHISNNHIVFDLKSLRCVLENLVNEPYLDKESIRESKELIENICNVIKQT